MQCWVSVVDTGLGIAPTDQARLFERFYRAEDYHQHYFARNPHQGYCAMVVAPKVAKFERTFRQRLRAA